MGMTMTEKIISRISNKKKVDTNEYVWVDVDAVGMSSALCIKNVKFDKVFDKERVYVTDDHSIPPSSIEMANHNIMLRKFVNKYKITNFFDANNYGIQHELFPNYGFVAPGEFVVLDDSHATSIGCYNALACSVFEEMPYILEYGRTWLRVPECINIELKGNLNSDKYVLGMDIALKLAQKYRNRFWHI